MYQSLFNWSQDLEDALWNPSDPRAPRAEAPV